MIRATPATRALRELLRDEARRNERRARRAATLARWPVLEPWHRQGRNHQHDRDRGRA
jgi:hypothetical protein